MIMEIIKAFAFITVAEMGDKTQLLAMNFATKYNMKKVLLGIGLGSALNHGLAIAFGTILGNYIDLNNLQIIGGIMFLIFGFWGLKSDDEEEEDVESVKYGAIVTVAIAFFLGELGDKTQLTAMTISTYFNYPIFVLLGTVSGMVFTGSLGIIVGYKIGEKVSEVYIKLVSSIVFMGFGINKLYVFILEYLNMNYLILFLGLIAIVAAYMARRLLKSDSEDSEYKRLSRKLRDQNEQLRASVENICESAANCTEETCVIGYIKNVLDSDEVKTCDMNFENQDLNRDRLMDAMTRTLYYYFSNLEENIENERLNITKGALEKEIFGEVVDKDLDFNQYMKELKRLDRAYAIKLENKLKAYGMFS